MPHDHCCDHQPVFTGASTAYRRTLWAVIAINAAMFAIEVAASLTAGSMALQADSLDFIADSATYALSLWVIAKPPRWRANAALLKGASLGVLGAWVLAHTLWRVLSPGPPEAIVMGGIGVLALCANLASVLLLLRFRDGDANVRSVWLCSRNDAIGNIAVVIAAGGVFATGTGWPDLIVAGTMASLFLSSSFRIVRHALGERAQLAASDA